MAAFNDPICHAKRITSSFRMIDIYLVEDVVKNKYLVKAYLNDPQRGVAHKFETYEEARACYILATLMLTNENVDFDKIEKAIFNPSYKTTQAYQTIQDLVIKLEEEKIF